MRCLFIGLAVFLSSSIANAELMTVSDCTGQVRASTQVTAGEAQNVKFVLNSDPANGAEFLGVSGKLIAEPLNDEQWIAKGIAPGEWKVCAKDGSFVSFSEITFSPSGKSISTMDVASAVFGAGALVGGLTAYGGSDSNDSGSGHLGTGPNIPGSADSGSGSDSGLTLPSHLDDEGNTVYDFGDPAAPLSPFS